MPLPTLSSDQIEDIYATTFNQKLPEIIDNVYNSNPFLGILNMEERILLDGGRRIEQGIVYGKLNGGSYGRGDTFNTARVNTKTAFIGDWKLHYTNITIDGMDDLQNAGAMAAFDSADLKAQECELTLKDNIGNELFGNGGNNGGKALDGLEGWVDDGTNFATQWGITRGTDPVGLAVKAYYDATGGSTTIPVLQTAYGAVTIENEKPNLLVTTQRIWNGLMNRVQPLQRYPSGPGFDELARIGFDAIKYQRAAVVVDSHVQRVSPDTASETGRIYGLNTRFIKLIVHQSRNAVLRGWMPTSNKDERINQVLWAGNLVVGGPRFQFQLRGMTA
jgi:hypothetical protein